MLDDAQLRTLEERLRYLREMEERRAAILESIREQGKLDGAGGADRGGRLQGAARGHLPAVQAEAADQGADRPGGRTGAAGRSLLGDPHAVPAVERRGRSSTRRGRRRRGGRAGGRPGILVERFAEDADLIGELREEMWTRAARVRRCAKGKEEAGAKFCRLLRLRRNRSRSCRRTGSSPCSGARRRRSSTSPWSRRRDGAEHVVSGYECGLRAVRHRRPGPAGRQVAADTVRWAWRTRILVHLGIDLRMRLWQAAEDEAVRVFAANLRDLLLAAPAGARATMGLDPGFRTGVKVAVVDATGKVVATETIYPHVPQRRWDESLATLARASPRSTVELIAIGNGTASRETDKLAGELIKGLAGAQAAPRSWSRKPAPRLLGLGLRVRGAARPRRVPARGGLHRAAAAGSAGGAGQDRSEVDRRRPVPARPGRVQALPVARTRSSRTA